MTLQPQREGRLPAVTAAPVPGDTTKLVLLLNPVSVGLMMQLGFGPSMSGVSKPWAHLRHPAWWGRFKVLVMSLGTQLLFAL